MENISIEFAPFTFLIPVSFVLRSFIKVDNPIKTKA